MTTRMSGRVRELAAERVPFVHAVVVRAQIPTSARTGDDAIVLADGSIEGFVGGQCAENSVRTAALGVLRHGESVLLRVIPEGGATFPDSPGAQVVVNPCLSGGALEIFLEPMLPPPLVEVVGQTPVADAIVAIADVLGYATSRGTPVGAAQRSSIVIIASHGRDEPASIRAALDAGAGYIALVASRRRGTAVLASLGLTDAERGRISTPAGLDIGARSAGEVALSILAEVVAVLRGSALAPAGTSPPPTGAAAELRTAVDPVCAMRVTIRPDTPRVVVGGETIWFCAEACRERYVRR